MYYLSFPYKNFASQSLAIPISNVRSKIKKNPYIMGCFIVQSGFMQNGLDEKEGDYDFLKNFTQIKFISTCVL